MSINKSITKSVVLMDVVYDVEQLLTTMERNKDELEGPVLDAMEKACLDVLKDVGVDFHPHNILIEALSVEGSK